MRGGIEGTSHTYNMTSLLLTSIALSDLAFWQGIRPVLERFVSIVLQCTTFHDQWHASPRRVSNSPGLCTSFWTAFLLSRQCTLVSQLGTSAGGAFPTTHARWFALPQNFVRGLHIQQRRILKENFNDQYFTRTHDAGGHPSPTTPCTSRVIFMQLCLIPSSQFSPVSRVIVSSGAFDCFFSTGKQEIGSHGPPL